MFVSLCFSLIVMLVCEQALRGALAAGREKQGELATTRLWNRPFPFSPGSLYQNEVKCSAFDVKSHANKTHFHKKGCALGLILKVRVFRTRKWPIRKSRCEMLIDGDNILSNDVITLDTSFSMFVYIRAPFRFALIGGNLTVQSTGCHKGNWRCNSNSRDVLASSPSFSRPAARAPRRACSQAILM